MLGICGGYQMLARSIVDELESGAGEVAGLGLLPVDVRFVAAKTLGRPVGSEYGEPVTTAYEIHHGIAVPDRGSVPFLDGCRQGTVWGTAWHGAWESDGFRRAPRRARRARRRPPRSRRRGAAHRARVLAGSAVRAAGSTRMTILFVSTAETDLPKSEHQALSQTQLRR